VGAPGDVTIECPGVKITQQIGNPTDSLCIIQLALKRITNLKNQVTVLLFSPITH